MVACMAEANPSQRLLDSGISFAPTDCKLVTCSDDSLIKIWDHVRDGRVFVCSCDRACRVFGAQVGVHRDRAPESTLTRAWGIVDEWGGWVVGERLGKRVSVVSGW